MPFPLIKIAYLAVRQISKPLANSLKRTAKTSSFLRNYILIPQAQTYHSLETTFKMRLLGLGKTKEVKPLSPEMAVELGADMFGEIIIFSVATATIFFEYRRQAKKEQGKEDSQNDKLIVLEGKVEEMGLQIAEQSAQIRELMRMTAAGSGSPTSSSTPPPAQPKQGSPTKIVDRKTGTILTVEVR